MLLEQISTLFEKKRRALEKNTSKMNPARVDREDERRMLPCRNFLDGFCPRGNRCRFYHPLPSSLPTVIRVPNLPSSFQQNNFGQYPVHSGPHSMFSLSPTPSSRSHMGLSPKMGSMRTPGSGRFLGLNGFANNIGRNLTTPISPTYSEYEMAFAQQMEIQKENERRATAPPVLENEDTTQNTVFSHINWKDFLTPGTRPPPPTHVPYMSNSPGGKPVDAPDPIESLIRSTENAKITSPTEFVRSSIFMEQMLQPEFEFEPQQQPSRGINKLPSPTAKEFMPQFKAVRGMSAKEELQLKVKQIAKELAAEPAQHVQSLDTFFRNYTFQSIPTPPSSEQDLFSSTGSRKMKHVSSGNISPPMTVETGTNPETIDDIDSIPTGAFSSEFSSGDSASSAENMMKAEADVEDPGGCNGSPASS